MAALHVLAHQGGWDEVILVGAPVLLFAGLLLLARKRAQDLVDERDAAARSSDPGDTGA
jgi:hypothetical protein